MSLGIKKSFLFLASVIALLMALIVAATISLGTSREKLNNAEYNRYYSYLLADELRQSSDDLTRMARTYVVTGNPLYREQYQTVLKIRDGLAPRPIQPERIYWDFMTSGQLPPRGQSESIALTELMQQAGFSPLEMAKLKEAKTNSDKLVNLENIAMDSVFAYYAGTTTAAHVSVSEAIDMMHSQEYHNYKIDIMKPIDDFYSLLDSRTLGAVQNARDEATLRESAIYLLLAISLVIIIITLLFVYRSIWRSLGAEPSETANLVYELSLGNLHSNIQIPSGAEASLLAYVKTLAENSEKLAVKADAIGKGEFPEEVPLLSENDRLGKAINEMNHLLRASKSKDEQRNWLNEGLNNLSMALSGGLSISEIGHIATSKAARYLDAGRGVIYLFDEEKQLLSPCGGYMQDDETLLGKSFKLGEGSVGQVAQEKQAITLSLTDNSNVPILTATTQANATHVYTKPLLHNDALIGVIELASRQPFNQLYADFLDSSLEVIASFLYGAIQNEHIQQLLNMAEKAENEARQHSERLQDANARMEEQHQQLQQQTEELSQSNTQLEEQQQQLQQQAEELLQTNTQMEEQQQLLELQNQELASARKLSEERATQLEQANQYKSEFLANMSHELRTPLNSINLLSKMMTSKERWLNTDIEAIEEETKKWAQIINRSGEDLLRLINDVLDLSKIEAGRMSIEHHEIFSAALASDIQEMFEHVAADKGLSFQVQDDIQGRFTSDNDKLLQIMRNLVGNAIKFTNTGSVSVTLSHANTAPFGFYLSVQDTGIGISKDKQPVIFDAFQQADGSTSREYGGTGLGLSISSKLAALLGGKITLKSEPGKGSLFSLYLPISSSEEKSPATHTPRNNKVSTNAGTEKSQEDKKQSTTTDDRNNLEADSPVILIIDDDEVLGQTLVQINHRLGYQTLVANTGQEGLEMAEHYRPNGILLDLGLPDMDGQEVLHELKGRNELSNIPVYIISARDQDTKFEESGTAGYLQKPLDETAIAKAEATLIGAVANTLGSDILVIENGGITAKQIADLLDRKKGATIAVQPNAELTDILHKHTFRLALIDLGADDITTGLSIAKQIHSLAPAMDLIFYSLRPTQEEESERLLQFSNNIIIKSTHSDQRLSENINRILQSDFSLAGIVSQAKTSAKPGESGKGRLKGLHILLADDDPRNLFVITAALENQGAKVSNVTNGRKALDFLTKSGEVDLVLMDIMMPEMNGYEATRHIRQQLKLRNLPIIVLTAKALPGDKDKALESGANDYLSKPVDYDTLIALTEKWATRKAL